MLSGLEYWEERIAAGGPRATGYRRKGEAFNRWMYRARVRSLERFLKSYRLNPRGLRVLDAGAGEGEFIRFWRDRGALPVALEAAELAVKRLRQTFPEVEIHRADLTAELPVEGQFDVVAAIDVLLHLLDERAFTEALGALAARVTPGGYLLIVDPLPKRSVPARPHCRLRPVPTYVALIEQTGLDVREILPIFLTLNAPSAISSPLVRIPTYLLWEALTSVSRLEPLGAFLGRTLYGLDGVLLPRCSWGPSSKLLVAQRVGER